jgi:transposase
MGTLYLGVDLHVRTQMVCWVDTADGELHQREFDHQRDDVRRFYAQLPQPAIVGVESCGYAVWFHRLVEETGHELRVGDARRIRQFAKRRQKNDRRDAALLLELLVKGDFPSVYRPSGASREVLLLLRGRERLVRMRTTLKNSLQALALSHQLRLGFRLWTHKGQKQFQALALPGADGLQREQMQTVLRAVEEQLAAAEEELQRRAAGDERVARLRTYPGVGLLTALAVVHTLEPVERFDRAKEVAAYCGLDPMERSSGDTVRYGHISKQGNRLLRHTLVEAAMSAARCEEELGRFYRKLRGKRKAHGVAIVAVARKLVLRLYRMLREKKDYEEFRRQGRDADVPGLPRVEREEQRD